MQIGERMKSQYEERSRFSLPRRTYTIIRADGRAFHTLTKASAKPFDRALMTVMQNTAINMCEQIQGAQFAYTQSDEISILLTDFATEETNAWFDGNVQKMASVSASIATAEFISESFSYTVDDPISWSLPATFDSRVFTIPDPTEVENYFIWRQLDATRNSVMMAARSVFSHKECMNKNGSELQEMLFQEGINWNDYRFDEKRGSVIMKDDGWKVVETPVFTQDREFLRRLIPKYENEKAA